MLAMRAHNKQVISPAVLNETTDDVLRVRIIAVLTDPALEAGSNLPPFAPFITHELLFRIRNMISGYSIEERGGWNRQAAVAKTVISVTGARKPRDFTSIKDFEAAGNIMDTTLKQYGLHRERARKGQMRSARRAQRTGNERPREYTRLAELQQRIFRCSRGCTPSQLVLLPSDASRRSTPIHKQPTQWAAAVNPDVQFERMQAELIAEKMKAAPVPVMEGVMRSIINTAELSGRKCSRAEQASAHAKESEATCKAELKHIKTQHAAAKRELKKQQAQSATAIAALEHKNMVLGAQIARAVKETFDEQCRGKTCEMMAAEKLNEYEQRESKLREAKARFAREAREAKEAAARAAFLLQSGRAGDRSCPSSTGKRPGQCDVRVYDFSDYDSEDPDFQPPTEEVDTTKKAKGESRAAKAREVKDAQEAALALKRMREMPTWKAARGKGTGKGGCKLEWGTRAIIYSLLAMMVPCSAIGMVIVAIVTRTAPWLKPTAPTVETVRRCRFELRYVEEASAARRVAASYRVRGIGFDETTKLGHAALTSNVTIEPTQGAPFEDIILRAAYCPLGGTSEKCVESIDKRCFSRLRDMLRRWEAKFREMFPNETWTGPDASLCGLHRLGGGGAIMSDTCNTARRSKKLLAALIANDVQRHMGSDAWDAMSADEQEAAVRTHQHDCWQHLRNIFLAEMSAAQAAHMKTELKEELDTFSSWERMSTDYSQLLRATYKEFHQGCRYYKGKGLEYDHWLRENHPKDFVLHLERADGGRQDLDFDAALPIYVDRKFFVEYLHGIVFGKDHSNILEDFLYVVHRSMQFIAATRANAIIDLLISRPMRWLTGNSHKLQDWSPYSMGEALDLVEQFFLRAQHDGSLFLDPELDIFEPIASKQPLFAKWRDFTFSDDARMSPDGSTRHLLFKLAKAELLAPADPTNMGTRAKTIEYLEVQCIAALRKMHDPKLALADKLTSLDGAQAVGNQAEGHADTQGCHASNDSLAESVFGTFDYILRRFGGISQEAASGVAQAVRSKILAFGDRVAHRKAHKKEEAAMNQPSYLGWFHTLPAREQEALVELARLTVCEMRDIDRSDHRELDEYKKQRRKNNEEDELDALFTRYALALSFFERWRARGVSTMSDVTTYLSALGEEGENTQVKLDWLREQIEMRTVGLGWVEFTGQWSSSKEENTGTVAQLKAHLLTILTAESQRRRDGLLPADCPAPLMTRKTFKLLGTPTVQADELSDERTDLTTEEMLAAAEKRRRELELAGEIDWVGDRQPRSSEVPLDNSILGVELEIRWRYRHKETGKPIYIWASGEVVQVADGEKDRKTPRCRKILPAGALRIKFPQDIEFDESETFVWCILNPKNFNKEVHLGWRLTAQELLKREATALDKLKKRQKQ